MTWNPRVVVAVCDVLHRGFALYNLRMPELPEVERVRLSLEASLVGRRVEHVTIHRADVVEPRVARRAMAAALLAGERISAVLRHGKQLAIVGEGEAARCICVHLGMTGSLIAAAVAPSSPQSVRESTKVAAGAKVAAAEATDIRAPMAPPFRDGARALHTHITWQLDGGLRLAFRDPRRFGGVWTFASLDALRESRWSVLGEDALVITPAALHERLRGTSRSLKAALLDQNLIAGLGNIYVDELLFELGLHPLAASRRMKLDQIEKLITAMRALLARAIAGGGSSLRDYVDGHGQAGQFQLQHRVYGRGGEPCLRCEAPLRSAAIAGRTTVFCPCCQRRSARRGSRQASP